jgi:tetratricopeptide (TPR) repeat protein
MSPEPRSDPLAAVNTGTVVVPQPYVVHLQAFSAHTAAGDRQAALAAASDACHAAPNRPEPHYAYGQAWLAFGEPAKAEQAFAAAVRIAPRWADAWINLGLCRYRQGGIEDAKAAMRNALRHAPGNQAAAGNLAAFMRISGESEAAETLLRRSIDTQPANEAARLNLAADLLQEERAADALALLDQAPALPEDPRARRHWLLQKSLALLQLNRPAEARFTLTALEAMGPLPPEILPLFLWRHLLLAMARDDRPTAMRAAEAMGGALDSMGPDAVPEHRIMAHYDLAKFWSGQGRNDIAFGHWIQGHALLKHIQPFSRTDHLAFVDSSIAAFPKNRFQPWMIARNEDPAPVFIVGMPRSGTTLCEQILAAHAHVHGAGERTALGSLTARLGTPPAIAALRPDKLDKEAAIYLAELRALAPGKTRIVDKMPGNYLYLGLVGLLFPKATIIHCVRDPRDIGLSIFTFRFHGHHGYAHDLADLGWTIAQQQRIMAHWRDVLPNPVLTVKLSDWVDDFDGTLQRLLTAADLPYDPNCARFHETESRVRTVSRSQVKQPVNARGLGRWRTYKAELQPLIEELNAAGALAGWGG